MNYFFIVWSSKSNYNLLLVRFYLDNKFYPNLGVPIYCIFCLKSLRSSIENRLTSVSFDFYERLGFLVTVRLKFSRESFPFLWDLYLLVIFSKYFCFTVRKDVDLFWEFYCKFWFKEELLLVFLIFKSFDLNLC